MPGAGYGRRVTRRQALAARAWIGAFVVVGAGVLAVLVGRAVVDGAPDPDPAARRTVEESTAMLVERLADVDGVASAEPLRGAAAVVRLDDAADRDDTAAWLAAVCRSGSALYARAGLQPVEPACLVTQGADAEWLWPAGVS